MPEPSVSTSGIIGDEHDAELSYRSYDPGVPRSIDYPTLPLTAMLRAAARLYPHRAAMIFQGSVTTYKLFDRLADSCAAGLQDAGVAAGDRVALVLPNVPQYPIALYGALRAGAVAVGCNPLYTAHELARQLADCGAETVIVLDRFLHSVTRAIELAQERGSPCAVKRVYSVDIAPFLPRATRAAYRLKQQKDRLAALPRQLGHKRDAQIVAGVRSRSFEQLLGRYMSRRYVESDRGPDDLAVLQYTGGTTGFSKGAMLTHGNLVANTLQVASWSPRLERGKEVVLCVAPFFHIYGLTVALNIAVYSGATMVLLPRFQIESVAKAIRRYRPTLWPGVPTMYVAVADLVEKTGLDCRSLKLCISGAAPLPVEVQQRFERLTGSALVEGYGLSEASPVTHCNPVDGRRVAGSIGLPYPDTHVRLNPSIVPGNNDPSLGELQIRGPQVMQGYWNRPDETASVLVDGWLHTGDIARVDADGYFYIVDRAKDMIIAGGFNVYPREVEEVLYMHPRVREAVVVGVADSYRGQTVKAYIVLRSEPLPVLEVREPGFARAFEEREIQSDIERFCRERLAPYKVPRQIEFRAELPKSMIGKILRRALRDEQSNATPVVSA